MEFYKKKPNEQVINKSKALLGWNWHGGVRDRDGTAAARELNQSSHQARHLIDFENFQEI